MVFLLYDEVTDGSIGRLAWAETLPLGVWLNVVGIYNGNGLSSGIKIYVNNVRVDNLSNTVLTYNAMSNGIQPVHIGKWGNSYAPSNIKSVKLYDVELTQLQIWTEYYSSIKGGLTEDLVAHWALSSDVTDSGGNGLDGINTDVIFPLSEWETYTGQISRTWRWVQVREVK